MPSPPPTAPVDNPGPHRPWEQQVAARRDRVEIRLQALAIEAAAELTTVDEALEPVGAELVAHVATGGKRLRPVLLLVGHELTGSDPDDVVGPAVGVELVHSWALLHDDVIDASDLRRGRPTTHRGFAQFHRDAGWRGNPEDHGQAIAVLLGDLVAVLANQAFDEATVPPQRHLAGRAAFADLQREVMAGQVLDVTSAAAGTTNLQRALKVATLKSGRYSITRPLQVGAILGGGSTKLLALLERAGDALGVAFQLRDDLLGMVGDHQVTGKPVGDDLREGKQTVLIAEAMQRLDDRAAARLRAALGRRDLDDREVEGMVTAMRACGAIDAVQTRIDDLLDSARADLATLDDMPATSALLALAELLATRQS